MGSYRSTSLESAPDRSYDVQPADERKGKATEGDRYLGKPIITHRLTFTRYPASTRAAPRQKNVAGMNNYWRRPPRARSRAARFVLRGRSATLSPQTEPAPAALLESRRGAVGQRPAHNISNSDGTIHLGGYWSSAIGDLDLRKPSHRPVNILPNARREVSSGLRCSSH